MQNASRRGDLTRKVTDLEAETFWLGNFAAVKHQLEDCGRALLGSS